MNRGRLPKPIRCRTCRCVRTALAQGLALDALLLVGLFGATVLYRGGWLEAYTLVIGSGIGKTILAGIAAAVKCWTVNAQVNPPGQH